MRLLALWIVADVKKEMMTGLFDVSLNRVFIEINVD